MFNKEIFIAQCKELAKQDDGHKRIKALLEDALKNPDGVITELGKPTSAGFEVLYAANNLSIINFVWAPGMELHAHNHNLWAVIGIYIGAEENTFYVRDDATIVKKNRKDITIGNVIMLGREVIHSVKNTTNKFTGGIHIYGGDFSNIERSQWDENYFTESAYDMEHTRKIFADANKIIAQ
jgi:predicted metal-dependent enzyme (double-stranded beta helix superfamily)